MKLRLTRALGNEEGVIDLGSIMAGILVVGALSAAVTTTVLQLIPWSEAVAAERTLQAVVTAQSSANAKDTGFLNLADLIDDGYLPATIMAGEPVTSPTNAGGTLAVAAGADGSCYVAVVTATTGSRFQVTSRDRVITEYLGKDDPCVDPRGLVG